MKPSAPSWRLAKLTTAGLVATAVGFLGAAVNPGPGPRVVKHFLSLGPLYLPPLLVGLTALAIAGLVAATRLRWAPATGAAFAAVLLVGAATLGAAAISYRLTHPGAIIGFAEDTLQLAGEVIALVAGLGATVQAYASPTTSRSPRRPRWTWVGHGAGAGASGRSGRRVPLRSRGTMANVRRQTVDLTEYPELVVVYLGMEAKTLSGVRTLASFGPKIKRAVEARPDGLLFHQLFLFSLLPLHAGIRQYWRDFDALERWVRAAPHRDWWRNLLRGGSGTAFWHETYFARGGMESIFLDLDRPTGLLAFAPAAEARGAMFSARRRLRVASDELVLPPLTEEELYRR